MKILFYFLLLTPFISLAQKVGIGTNTPNNSALLDLTSSNKGLLIPRMTTQARLNNIASPATGLMVYDSTKKVFFYYDGAAWQSLQTTGKIKTIYVPGGALSYNTSADITKVELGLKMGAAAPAAYFIIPKPVDWDPATPFTISLQFAIPSLTYPLTLIKWRLRAESVQINKPGTGWDSYEGDDAEDAPVLILSSSAGYSNYAQQQTWTSKFSNTYHTYYFGPGVNTNNDFISGLLWKIGFQRGVSANNGENYANDLIITGATITYTSK